MKLSLLIISGNIENVSTADHRHMNFEVCTHTLFYKTFVEVHTIKFPVTFQIK